LINLSQSYKKTIYN